MARVVNDDGASPYYVGWKFIDERRLQGFAMGEKDVGRMDERGDGQCQCRELRREKPKS
jgi:hypothetical protein